jgi:hypothetical protein
MALEYLDRQKVRPLSFCQFNQYAESLEGICAERGNSRRLSVMADLLHDRADRKDIRFADLVQADVICCIAESVGTAYMHWYPRSLIYCHDVGTLELFTRAASKDGFEPLRTLLGVSTPNDMIQQICSERMRQIWDSRELFQACVSVNELLNLDEIRRRWPALPK